MSKLLPPLLENIIPAFYKENGVVIITIPFSMNRAVNKNLIKGISIKIKTTQSSTYLYDTVSTEFSLEPDNTKVWLRIYENDSNAQNLVSKLKVGQFYKIQIAYVDLADEVGYYSNTATCKYTTQPNLSIAGLDVNTINARSYLYTGIYSQKGKDTTETVYSYKFNVYNEYSQLIYTSGEQIHNGQNDDQVNIFESSDNFDFPLELENNKTYFIEYLVTTINGLTASSFLYRISQRPTLDPEIDAILTMVPNVEDGYIQINLIGNKDGRGEETLASGSFILTRACVNDNEEVWEKLITINLLNEKPTRILFKDFTTEQGKYYKYSLQQFNARNLFSNRIMAINKDSLSEHYDSTLIRADFEHLFLYDGKRQLKVKYNPKVSSFKINILETKTDTIGGQYPFLFRNGSVKYREFPISGLISLLSDENSYFMESPLRSYDRPGTPAECHKDFIEPSDNPLLPTTNNFYNERNFKTEVLKWLTDGNPKLFRSAAEGNFIIRLMNTSLTPNDQLGRMLHTFNTTAYEIAEYNHTNLIKYGFLSFEENYTTKTINWRTVKLEDYDINEVVNHTTTLTLDFFDMSPGDEIKLSIEGGQEIPITIGATGQYRVDAIVPIKKISLLTKSSGYLTYSYYAIVDSEFGQIADMKYVDIPATQIVGECESVYETLGFILKYEDDQGHTRYVLNPKLELLQLYYLKGERRPWKPLYMEFKKDPVTGEDLLELGATYWINPIQRIKFIDPDSSLLYRGVKMPPFLFDPSDYKNLTENSFYKYKGKNDLYIDFHKNYWHINENNSSASNIVGKNYFSYNPYFHYISKTLNNNNYNNQTQTIYLDTTHFDSIENIKKFNSDTKKTDIIDSLDNLIQPEYITNSSYPMFTTNKITNFNPIIVPESYNVLQSFDDIKVENGVIFSLGYLAREIDYLIEDKDSNIKLKKEVYQDAVKDIWNYMAEGGPTEVDIDVAKNHPIGIDINCDIFYRKWKNARDAYKDYCLATYKALEQIHRLEQEGKL